MTRYHFTLLASWALVLLVGMGIVQAIDNAYGHDVANSLGGYVVGPAMLIVGGLITAFLDDWRCRLEDERRQRSMSI